LAVRAQDGWQVSAAHRDTDLQRSTEESTRSIIEGLEWLGLDYDEDLVFQSDNAEKHRAALGSWLKKARLIATSRQGSARRQIRQAGHSRTSAGASSRRSRPTQQSFRDLSKAESDARAGAGVPFAIRLKVSREGQSRFADIVYGEQERRTPRLRIWCFCAQTASALQPFRSP